MEHRNERRPHILNTASNLLGFCLLVQTSLQLANRFADTFIDEFMPSPHCC